jgi:glycosyltransferase involved in cell wall biosynthesis
LSYANIAAIVAHRFGNTDTRLILREATNLSHYNREVDENRRDVLVRRTRAYLYRHANGFIAVSNGVARDLTEQLGVEPDRISVICNPLPVDEIRIRGAEPVGHPWFQKAAPPVVITIGRLSLQKDQASLVEAFSQVRARLRVRLVILGEGPQRAHLEGLVRILGLQDDVWMPGHVDNPYRFLARSRVFVLSSRVEGLPNAMLEAMACGIPMIATNCPSGPDEILENGKWGRLVPPRNPQALADAMLAVLEDGREPIDYAGALEKYHLDRVASRYLEILLPQRHAA